MANDQSAKAVGDDPTGETSHDFEDTDTLPDHVEEELEIEDVQEPDPEEAFVENDETKYTDPDV